MKYIFPTKSSVKKYLNYHYNTRDYISYNRKRKLETNLLESIWKVTLKDIDLQKAKFGFGSKVSYIKHQKIMMNCIT